MKTHDEWGRSVAWAAGLFDGEGCIGLYRRKVGWRANLQLAMTDEDVMRRFADVVGTGNVNGPYAPSRSSTLDSWRWSIDGFERIQYVLAMFWPWFGDRRRAKAREVLLAVRHRAPGHRLGGIEL